MASLPPASIPAVPILLPSLSSNPPTATPSTARASKRKATWTDYTDLDENGELDAPTPKKHRTVKKVANKPKAGSKIKKHNPCRSAA